MVAKRRGRWSWCHSVQVVCASGTIHRAEKPDDHSGLLTIECPERNWGTARSSTRDPTKPYPRYDASSCCSAGVGARKVAPVLINTLRMPPASMITSGLPVCRGSIRRRVTGTKSLLAPNSSGPMYTSPGWRRRRETQLRAFGYANSWR